MRPGRSRYLLWMLAALVPIALALVLPIGSPRGEHAVPTGPETVSASADSTAPAPRPRPAVAGGAISSPDQLQREVTRRLWERRLERTRQTLDSYLEATRYPPTSRPISEHPDQVRPSSPERNVPLDPSGEDGVRLSLRQEKVFLVGEESVGFFVRCEDRQGQALPCEILSATAHEAPHRAEGRELAAVPLTFTDDGSGTLTARFQPARDGFPMYEGTLRVEIKARSGTVEGGALFDVIYTPAAPATFTGSVREAVESGSLDLFVELNVRKPGRYVITGRVDDATGTPFALVTFNEELNAGRQEAKLTVFGRLILDQHPAAPLTLRDVEGFLLRESGDPDRELMAGLLGPVHRTAVHPESAFSAQEWQSEERDRYVKEFTRDLEYARDKVAELTP